MANPTLAREGCAAINCTGLPYCISWHMQQFSLVFKQLQGLSVGKTLGIADLMRVIAALGTFEKDRTSRPIYQTENGLHTYSLHSNTTANEGRSPRAASVGPNDRRQERRRHGKPGWLVSPAGERKGMKRCSGAVPKPT